ncbi:MAG TPA: histidine kinase, partial [Streptosporangiaceae bacterium]|nr:histidine kinase [Streptosporangiaceae bacterium]
MTALAPHRDAPIRRRDRAPWSPRAWSQALYLTGAIPVLAVVPLLLVVAGLAIKPRWVLPLVALVVALLAVPLLSKIHRHRLRATAGVVIEPQPFMPNGLNVAGIREAIRSPITWRQLGYHFMVAPALAVAAATAFAMWLAGVLYALVYTYAWTLPARALLARGQSEGPPGHLPPMSSIPMDVYLAVGGLALLMAAPWLTAGFAALDVRAAQALLGPSRAEELEHRVERLTQTRAGVVDAADAERRRLERNLHDGTQQRLVSLAMNLGMARAQTETVEEAHEAITEAHEEAKAALAELRNLIRGLHPPVLENRGLDAALSGVAARMPIPVRLTVNVPRRPPPTIEAVAYFVVSEGLTN